MEAFHPLLVCCWLLVVLAEAAVLPEQKLPMSVESSDLAKVNQAEIGSPLRVAQCRARCLQTVSCLKAKLSFFVFVRKFGFPNWKSSGDLDYFWQHFFSLSTLNCFCIKETRLNLAEIRIFLKKIQGKAKI
jgi:hypothetical protein